MGQKNEWFARTSHASWHYPSHAVVIGATTLPHAQRGKNSERSHDMYVSIDALGVPSHVQVSEVIEALLERRYKVFRVLHPARYAHEPVGDANLQPDARGPEKVKAEGGVTGLPLLDDTTRQRHVLTPNRENVTLTNLWTFSLHCCPVCTRRRNNVAGIVIDSATPGHGYPSDPHGRTNC